MTPIYLDNHATTPVDPRVLEAMLPYLGPKFGNASSTAHAFGWAAAEAVALARERVATLIGATPDEVLFTSGATESNNLAILGTAALARAGARFVTTSIEHPSVADVLASLEARGFRVTVVPVDRSGMVDVDAIADAVDDDTVLVSVMGANNEVGTIQPVAEVARRVRPRVLLHCDAAQGVGRIPVDVEELGVDFLSLSAHKCHGPKGVGALHVRGRGRRATLAPVIHGAGQEKRLRPGTLNVPGIVGLGVAALIARDELAEDMRRIASLRDELQRRVLEAVPGARVNGHPSLRTPGNLSVTFPECEAEELILAMPSIAVSTGAACSSGSGKPSRVLRALGLTEQEAKATLRFGLGRATTAGEVEEAAGQVAAAWLRVRRRPVVG